jgi:tetratricopeptide (TPR) repeat protein
MGTRWLLALPQRSGAWLRRHPALGSLVLLTLASLLALGGYRAVNQYLLSRQLALAQQELARDDFDAARARLSLCLRSWPRNATVPLLAARAARRAGDTEEAQQLLDQCQRLARSARDLALERELLEVQQGRLGAVEASLLSRLERGDGDPVLVLEALAQGYRKTGRLDHAVLCLDKWLQLRPDAVQALLWRGEIWQQINETDRALESYHKAHELDSNRNDVRLRLAEMLLRKLDLEGAVEQYEYLYRQEPGNPVVVLGLARCRRDQGRTSEAQELIDSVLATSPRHVQAMVERGKLALSDGHVAEAEAWLRRAVEVAPFDREATYTLSQCLFKAGKTAEAKKYDQLSQQIGADLTRVAQLATQIAASPHDPQPRYEGGVLLLRIGREETALQWLQGALQEMPGHTSTHEALADYYARKGNNLLAEQHREAARRGRANAGDLKSTSSR